MNNNWKTSVNELLVVFRGALIAIIPWIEKVKIKWKEGESYDDWDNIEKALFDNIVCSSLIGEVTSEYPIAKYNYQYENYYLVDFILVKSKNYIDRNFAFVSFVSDSFPLDSVKVAELDKLDKVVGYLNLRHDEVMFSFIRNNKGRKEVIDEVDVIL